MTKVVKYMNTNGHISQRVLVVDDHILFREGLISLFESAPDFHVVGCAGTIDEGVEKAFHHEPDILLVDQGLLGRAALETVQTILDQLPDCKIIFLTVHEMDKSLVNVMDIGVVGYLLKNITGASLLETLRVLAGRSFCIS